MGANRLKYIGDGGAVFKVISVYFEWKTSFYYDQKVPGIL